MSMSSFLGDMLQTISECGWRFLSFGPHEDTNARSAPRRRSPALLAFAPGGSAEMTIVSFAWDIEVASIVRCHVFRSIFIVAAAPALYCGLHRA
jgi:hypothetical protein